jgi:hypothetical protein
MNKRYLILLFREVENINKKICAVAIVLTLVLLGIGTVSNAEVINQKITRQPKTASEQILLGSASVFGDGTEENTVVDAIASDDLTVSIASQTEIVDFYITYDIEANGDNDFGVVFFGLQINGEHQELQEVNITGMDSGDLILEDVEVSRGDILTFEISAVYTNLIPPHGDLDIDVGGGIVSKPVLFNLLFEKFPVISYLLSNSFFIRLLNI